MMNTNSSARIFLARVMAWPQEGEPLAYVNIHNTFEPQDMSKVPVDKKTGKPRLPWAGRACRSLDEAANNIAYASSQPSTKDMYFCTSTQSYAETKIGQKSGKPWLKAVRASENAVKMKSLFLDSDLKAGDQGYATPQEFGEALKQFLIDTGLPRPTIIVSSGGGFHIYWTFQSALTTEQWMPLAYALVEATKQHGFKCDTQCTIDAARVLRIPGTKNFKYDPPRDVTLLGNPVEYDYANEKLEAALEPYKVQVPYSVLNAAMSILPPKAPIPGTSDLSAGIDTSSSAPVKIDSLVHECGFVAEALSTGGASFQNPLWNLTTLISTFTEGGRADAHRMAAGHSGYDPAETDELFDRKTEDRLVKNLGWPKCSTIASSGCTSCGTCPHFPENKSPLNFGEKALSPGFVPPTVNGIAPAGFSAGVNPLPGNSINSTQNAQTAPAGTSALQTPQTAPQPTLLVPGTGQQDPDLPIGYLRNNTGVILYAHSNEDGTSTWYPVTRYPMIDPWMQRDPWSLNFTTETEHGKLSQITVPCKDVGTSEMKKALQEQGFMVGGGSLGFNKLSDFIMAWINKLQTTKDSIVTSVPFGWLVRSGKTKGFVYGGKLHTPTGTEIASNTDPELARQFSPEGDEQPWLDAAMMITDQKRPALDAILASAFAGPLVRFTGHSGLLMSAYSPESGIGKSTALKIAQAVWGDPVKAVQSLSDTQNSVLNKLGELRSLPVYWDELKSEDDTKRFIDTVFRLTLGKEKSRMTSKVQQRTPGTWQTIMVAASNESLMDSIAYKTRATTAGLYRVFEFTVKKPLPNALGQIDATIAQRILSKLHDNYGSIGLRYASYLGSNHVQVDKDVETIMSNVGKEVGMQPDERFWVALIGTILLGAKYANFLGFTQIDEVGLKKFLYSTLADMRSERNAQPVDMKNVTNVVNTLARYLNENRMRHTLVTSIIHKQRGKPPVGTVQVVGDASRLDSIHVHVGLNDHTIRIGQSYLYDWLSQNNYPRHVFLKALQSELGATTLSGRLGAGTPFANATEYLIEIDISGSPLMNFLDEA